MRGSLVYAHNLQSLISNLFVGEIYVRLSYAN